MDTIELSDALETILAEIVVQNIPIRIENGDTAAIDDLIDILEAVGVPDGAVSLINPDLIELLRTSPDPLFHAEDILEASNGDFSVDNDPLVFIRPYLLNFNALIEAVDVAASFYAGLAPIDESRITILLEECALSSLGLTWTSNVEMLSLTGGSTCGEEFIALFDDFVSKRSMEDFVPRGGMNRLNAGDKGLGFSFPLGNVSSFGPQIEKESPVIARIRNRGYIECGLAGKEQRPGFATYNETTDSWSGFALAATAISRRSATTSPLPRRGQRPSI